MIKQAIILSLMLAVSAVAAGVTHGWIIYQDKSDPENLADATALLNRINANFPKTNPFSGKVYPYWMREPLAVKRVIPTTNEFGVVESVATNTGAYLIYIRPSVAPVLTEAEADRVTDALPEGTFIEGE